MEEEEEEGEEEEGEGVGGVEKAERELEGLSVRQLKDFLVGKGVDTSDCIEKMDLGLIKKNRTNLNYYIICNIIIIIMIIITGIISFFFFFFFFLIN